MPSATGYSPNQNFVRSLIDFHPSMVDFFFDFTDVSKITFSGNSASSVSDKFDRAIASQPTASLQPIALDSNGDFLGYLTFNGDFREKYLTIDFPSEYSGYIFAASKNCGIYHAPVNIPKGMRYLYQVEAGLAIIFHSSLQYQENIYALLEALGAVRYLKSDLSYCASDKYITEWNIPLPNNLTSCSNTWRENKLTEWNIPLPDNLIRCEAAWYGNNLTEWNIPLPDILEVCYYAWYRNQLKKWNIPLPDSLISCSFAWAENKLTEWNIPLPDNLNNCRHAWENNPLTTVSSGLFDNCNCRNYENAFFNCALDSTSVDNIVVSIKNAAVTNNLTGGILGIHGGTNATPSTTGLAAVDILVNYYGWTVTHN